MAEMPEFESEMHRTAVAQLDQVAERLNLDHDTHIRLRYPRLALRGPFERYKLITSR